MTDDFEKQIDEMKILEIKSRMATRILEIHEVILKLIYWAYSVVDDTKIGSHSTETKYRNRWHTIEKIAFLFRACQPVYTDKEEMARVGSSILSFIFPIFSISEENRNQDVMNYASSTFSRRRDPNGFTMKSYSSMTPASRRRPTVGSTTILRSKSQSYRETQSDAQLMYKANFLRNVRTNLSLIYSDVQRNAPDKFQTKQ